MILILLVCFTSQASTDIDRRGDGFKADFSVINKGRLHDVIMYMENTDLAKCLATCIFLLRCLTINYNHELRKCELTDKHFNVTEADVNEHGWLNYGTPVKVNGGFSEWISEECSVSCGKGEMRQTRSCNNPPPTHNGDDCVGERSRILTCDRQPCSELNDDLRCIFKVGDGISEKELYLGKRWGHDCIEACLEKRKADPVIDGVTLSDTGRCWCEKKMTVIRADRRKYKSCFIKSNASSDGSSSDSAYIK